MSHAHQISLLLVRNVRTSCGKGCASIRSPELPDYWEAWVEVMVELSVSLCDDSFSSLILVLYVLVYLYVRHSLLFVSSFRNRNLHSTFSTSATFSSTLMLTNRIVIPTVHMKPFSTMEHHGNSKRTRHTNN